MFSFILCFSQKTFNIAIDILRKSEIPVSNITEFYKYPALFVKINLFIIEWLGVEVFETSWFLDEINFLESR